MNLTTTKKNIFLRNFHTFYKELRKTSGRQKDPLILIVKEFADLNFCLHNTTTETNQSADTVGNFLPSTTPDLKHFTHLCDHVGALLINSDSGNVLSCMVKICFLYS